MDDDSGCTDDLGYSPRSTFSSRQGVTSRALLLAWRIVCFPPCSDDSIHSSDPIHSEAMTNQIPKKNAGRTMEAAAAAAVPPPPPRRFSALPKKRWICDVCQIRTFENYDEACRHEEQCRAVERLPMEITVDNDDEDEVDVQQEKPVVEVEVHAFFRPQNRLQKRSKQTKSTTTNNKSSSLSSTRLKTSSKTSIPLDTNTTNRRMDVSDPQIIHEKEQAWKLWKKNNSSKSQSTTAVVSDPPSQSTIRSSSTTTKKQLSRHAAPRFPRYSHVIGSSETLPTFSSSSMNVAENNAQKNNRLSKDPPPRRIVQPYPPEVDEENRPTPPILFCDASTERNDCLQQQHQYEDVVLQQLLSQLLLPPHKIRSSSSSSSRLWVDIYCRGDPPVGIDMQQAHSQIQQFIERFQIQRTQAMTRMAERQRRMNKHNHSQKSTTKSKPKRRRHEEDDDDDWFWDSEDDENEDDVRNRKLCVWTGPVGYGKSAGVHAIAHAQHCRILEIHTGQKRGTAAIKRCIQEATQSHSLSMDKQPPPQLPKEKTRKTKKQPLFFQKTSSRVLVDTESDDDEEEQRQPQLRPSLPEPGEAAAITVILIDEVDNLYHEHGDSGFWTALNELYKKSKCPIILTANTLPSKLEANSTNTNSSTAFRFVHVRSQLPTPSECAERLWTIANAEGFRFRDTDRNHQQQLLEKIAILANCDMRRLVHQLQIMSLPVESDAVSQPPETKLISNSDSCDLLSVVSSSEWTNLPRIESVQPHAILVGEYSLLTIHGSQFLSLASENSRDKMGYPCEVYVGDQLCPRAVILDDATILAVAAPPSVSNRVDITTGKYQDARSQKSLMAEYATLTVNSISKQGIISSTQNTMTTVEVPDGTRVTMPYSTCCVEIHFPGHISMGKTSGSVQDPNESSENEFEPRRKQPPTTSSLSSVANSISPDVLNSNLPLDSELVSNLFQKGIEDWCSKNSAETKPKPTASMTCDIPVAKTMESIAWDCELLSDAALLEDVAAYGTPYLSGSCRGYGYELTDEYPKYTNETTKPPPEDRLFDLGWKDDNFFYGSADYIVTNHFDRRERDLLIRTEQSLRGMSCRTMENIVEDEENENGMSQDLPVDRTEEDMFLPHGAPTSLGLLPASLRRTCRNLFLFLDPVDNYLFRKKKQGQSKSMLDILCEFMFPGPSQTRLLYKAMSRLVDPLVRTCETLDQSLFLDYLPLLRCMAVHEHIANTLLDISRQENPVGPLTTNRKRSTRRGRKLGREHYLEVIAPAYTFQNSDQTAKTVGDSLCRLALICERYVPPATSLPERKVEQNQIISII